MRGRKLRIVWREEAKVLQNLYRRENNPDAQRRLQALWLVRQGYKLGQVAWLIGVHYRTISRWLSWYREGGTGELIARRRGNLKGRTPFLSEDQIAKLGEELGKGSLTGTKEAIAWVRESFGVNYSYWGMYSLLRRIGFSRRGSSRRKGERA